MITTAKYTYTIDDWLIYRTNRETGITEFINTELWPAWGKVGTVEGYKPQESDYRRVYDVAKRMRFGWQPIVEGDDTGK